MNEFPRLIIICVTVFATASSIAWAIAFGAAYSPPASPYLECSRNPDARGSAYCHALAQSGPRR